jgi:nitroreductase
MPGYERPDLVAAVAAGIRAPSLHNSQPWLFRLRDGGIEVLTDDRRRPAVADRTGWAARIVPQMVLRPGYGVSGPGSARRPPADVIVE